MEQTKNKVADERYQHVVASVLSIQEKKAVWWGNACLLYFQTFSNRAVPDNYEKPDQRLEYYKQLSFLFSPGN